MERTRRLMVGFIIAAAIGLTLRVWGTANKRTIGFDESISYLVATGHQFEFHHITPGWYSNASWPGRPPFGTWVNASEWKRFTRIEKPYCFADINKGLLHFDLHPPLYFWLLHLWGLHWQMQPWTGPSLNLIFVTLTLFALFGFTRYVFGNSLEAAAVTAFCALSPALIVGLTLRARQYDLLALLAVLFMWLVIYSGDPTARKVYQGASFIRMGWWHYPAFALLVGLGMLTHYHFMLLVAGGALLLIYTLRKTSPRRLAGILLAMAAGSTMLFALFPGFWKYSTAFQRSQAQSISLWGLLERIRRTLTSISSFFTFEYTVPAYLLPLVALLFILFVIGLIVFYRHYRAADNGLPDFRYRSFAVLYFLIWLFGAMAVMFIAFLMPEQNGMKPRHLTMFWLTFVFVPVFILRLTGKYRLVCTSASCLAMLVLALVYVPYLVRRENVARPPATLASATHIICDSAQRGRLIPILWQTPEDAHLFVATQEYLLKHQNKWAQHLNGAVYISTTQYRNTPEQRDAILHTIHHRYTTTYIANPYWETGQLYEIETSVSSR